MAGDYFPPDQFPRDYFPDAHFVRAPPEPTAAPPVPTSAVTQGSQYGHDYPFVLPAADVRGAISDFYLSLPAAGCGLALPLRLEWLYGFGEILVDVAPYAPVHPHDLRVLDAQGELVFDSRSAAYGLVNWGPRRVVVTWGEGDAVCRVVGATGAQGFADHITPSRGELDSRSYEALPPRLTSLAGLAPVLGLEGGYNVALTSEEALALDGGRRVGRVRIDATPGGGQGRLPGCGEPFEGIRLINGVPPDQAGNFLLNGKDCYRHQMPVTANGLVANYGNDRIGPADAPHGWVIYGDCAPCCSCDDFVNTYRGLKKVWDQWDAAAAESEAIRDVLQDNIDRWEDQRTCRTAAAGRLISVAENACKSQLGGSYVNPTPCCLRDLEIRFTAAVFVDGTPLAPGSVSAVALDGRIAGTGLPVGGEPYVMGGAFPIYKAHFDQADPAAVSAAQFRLCVSGCQAGWSVRVTVTVHVGNADTCELPVASVPPAVTALWASVGDVPTALAVAAVTRSLPLTDAGSDRQAYRC